MLDRQGAERVHLVTTRSLSYTSDAGPPPGLPDQSEILGRAAGENFSVASVFLPRSCRRDLMAFYGYARLVDQLGDDYPGDRLAALDWLESETRAALDGAEGCHVLVADAARSLRRLRSDPTPLFDLIEANRLDQRVRDYSDFAQLLDYCRLSANPVGRLVLAAFGYSDRQRIELSDAICTGLQLVEHWQDVREDARAGRVYLPGDDLDRFGVHRSELTGAGPSSPALRSLMAFEVSRARQWLDRGKPLTSMLAGRFRLAVSGFWAGGHAALDAIADRDFDVLTDPARPRPDRVARRALSAVLGRSG